MIPVIYSEEFLKHDTGSFHPECPQRLTAIVKTLKESTMAKSINWQLPTDINHRNVLPFIEKVHTPDYINGVKNIASNGGGRLDSDTPVSPLSYEIALLAVSAWLDGVDEVLNTSNPAFVLARPPGHHAISERGMGFCLFSNAAIAAYYALEKSDINKVAILDWDVHHGNGTESIIQSNANIRYCSTHQYPCYPGTGEASYGGKWENILNIPMIPGSSFNEYKVAFESKIIPFLEGFQPDLLIVSAGYDGNRDDPLADINLLPQDYGVFTDYCLGITRKILFGLEGGYDLQSLSDSVLATIASCL